MTTNPDEKALDELTIGSMISSAWVKRLDRKLKRRLDAKLLRNRWAVDPTVTAGQWLIVPGAPAAAVIEIELKDGQNRTDIVYEK